MTENQCICVCECVCLCTCVVYLFIITGLPAYVCLCVWLHCVHMCLCVDQSIVVISLVLICSVENVKYSL